MKLTRLQIIVFLFLILTPLFFSMLPFAVQSAKTPPDRVFMGLHRWSEDYYGYLHTINQGIMGHLRSTSKLTLEPHEPAFVHSEYAFLGLIGGLFGLNSVLVYHLSRLFLGFIFLIVSFYFFYLLFKTPSDQKQKLKDNKHNTNYQILNTIIAFFLAFFASGFPKISPLTTTPSALNHLPSTLPFTFEPYLSWWVELDVVRRSTILPHYLMGSILFLTVLICVIKILNKKSVTNHQYLIKKFIIYNLKFIIILVASSFLLSFVHPVDYLILLCTLGLFFLFQIFFQTKKYYSENKKINIYKLLFYLIHNSYFLILILIITFLSGLLPILYYKYTLTLPFWRFIMAHGTTTQYSIPLFDFVMSQGVVFLLAIGGIFILAFSVWRLAFSKNILNRIDTNSLSAIRYPLYATPLLLLSWLIAQSLFFLYLYKLFNFDRLRTLHPPYYLALAFFAALFLTRLKRITVIIIIIVITIISLPLTIQSVNSQIHEVSDFKYFPLFSYPSVKQYQAFTFLKTGTPDNSIITSMYEASFLIPAVSGNKIAYAANFENDPGFAKNREMIAGIYQGNFDEKEAVNFLKANKIEYLYWGYQEKSMGGDLTKYPFLSTIFDNGEAAVFKVN